MASLVRVRSNAGVFGRGAERALARTLGGALLLAGLQLSCGKSASDDDDGPAKAGEGGAGGSTAGSASGGTKAGSGGKAGSSAGGAGAGGAGAAGIGGSKSGAAGSRAGEGGDEAAGAAGEDSGNGGSGGGGQSSGGTAGSNAGGEGGAVFELPEVLVPLVDAFCAAARTCCAEAGQPPAALDACEEAVAGDSLNFRNVARGTLDVDAGALDACVAAYVAAAGSCAIAGVLDACHGIFKGTIADGAACGDALECDRASGPRVCEIILSQGDGDTGTCVDPGRGALGTACGGDCRENGNCSSTFISTDEVNTTLCFEADGLFCRGGEECAELIEDGQECPDGQGCSSASTCSGNCTPLGGLGAECFFTPDCAQGFICQSSECVAAPFADAYTCVGKLPTLD
jgi:hypothetical protein